MPDWKVLNSCRIRTGPMASEDSDGFNGAFRLWVGHRFYNVVASNGLGWEHVSVSIADEPTKTPKWEAMCDIKNIFWGEDLTVVQFHPKRSEYVNFHPGVLHMWRPTDPAKQIELPPSIFVGPKPTYKIV